MSRPAAETPLIIIGAGRSGTNILRDTLTAAPGWATWPCDEINLIWRHGNRALPHDAFTAEDARPAVAAFIRRAFERLERQTGAQMVVEKTCANTLRVPFVEAIFPKARYIYLLRDGRDAALSAARRWTAGIEPRYLMRKLQFAPVSDLPHYAVSFARNRLAQAFSDEKRQSVWGPRFPGMADYARKHALIEVCARQWSECVAACDAAMADMAPDKVFRLRYEEFVADPRGALSRIGDWIEAPHLAALPDQTIARIRAGGPDWRAKADQFTPEAHAIMRPLLERHGYAAT